MKDGEGRKRRVGNAKRNGRVEVVKNTWRSSGRPTDLLLYIPCLVGDPQGRLLYVRAGRYCREVGQESDMFVGEVC